MILSVNVSLQVFLSNNNVDVRANKGLVLLFLSESYEKHFTHKVLDSAVFGNTKLCQQSEDESCTMQQYFCRRWKKLIYKRVIYSNSGSRSKSHFH